VARSQFDSFLGNRIGFSSAKLLSFGLQPQTNQFARFDAPKRESTPVAARMAKAAYLDA
jgi:hypothetical protein